MGWSYRKSKRIGPFRLNLSRSGLGLSLGVKGARVGISSRGRRYGSLSLFGFSYRTYGSSGPNRQTPSWPLRHYALVFGIIALLLGAALPGILLLLLAVIGYGRIYCTKRRCSCGRLGLGKVQKERVGSSWLHNRKDGEPDHRYRHNPRVNLIRCQQHCCYCGQTQQWTEQVPG
ncbi:DUF4236 domain-containing protein [Dongshaea marina]|uniref:DUF4236 domain-containing protein n=1 Tax=Dongshaea marina TaxID=2047966 RepID=UPI000D3E43ED|nr:DUF4236 domain-containing protein [Dongshaea marina]